ncbi:hypothetical protein [Pseudoalteromonas agarivorans]|uniref:Uncharacterized protein n=1 Tax=Pseudoalteromonas agarivorans DSM 14585 TaxID=1312369 RepID=A0ACA8DWL2_9GAMM|nr:hypothetical protein [Pseudoalteromonas agarivorans]ATC82140.1 hypothetical protein PAGA_a1776 [Pseudoalteromonas agarivorans DSM 14585]
MDSTAANPQKHSLTLDIFEEHLHKAIDKPTVNYRMVRVGPSRNGRGSKLKVHNGAHKATWAKTTINSRLRTINIDVYLNFKQNSLQQGDYLKLKTLAIAGIKQYWSNTITVAGVRFNVIVNPLHKSSSDAIPVDLEIEESESYGRSMNPAILGIDSSFIYQRGSVTAGIPSKLIDDEFKLVSAHEFGHSVLIYVGGINLSWGHKGSTNILLQNVKASSPGYPNQGKIDLMKYYNDTKNTANLKQRITRSEALEVDIKRLIWSSEVLWKD